MPYTWTKRQFVGGTIALDFANTVCYRDAPARRFDKIADAAALADFARAALALSDVGARRATLPAAEGGAPILALYREIRDSTDALLRPIGCHRAIEVGPLRTLLRLHQDLLAGHYLRVGATGLEVDPDSRPSFALVLTESALRLAGSTELARVKICPSCHWLFIDRSRNASRTWCDMLTCGNRAKARRHQLRRRLPPAKPVHGG